MVSSQQRENINLDYLNISGRQFHDYKCHVFHKHVEQLILWQPCKGMTLVTNIMYVFNDHEEQLSLW